MSAAVGVIILLLIVGGLTSLVAWSGHERGTMKDECIKILDDIVYTSDYSRDVLKMSEREIKLELKDAMSDWYHKSDKCLDLIDITPYGDYMEYLPVKPVHLVGQDVDTDQLDKCQETIDGIIFDVDYSRDILNMSEKDIQIELRDNIKTWYDMSIDCSGLVDVTIYDNYTDYLPVRSSLR